MKIQAAYNTWADTYDAMRNQTRDTEAAAIRELLAEVDFAEVIEIGCGTGKNTEWLATRATQVTAVDFSTEMLNKARAKIGRDKVRFQQADITQQWAFVTQPVDLITCSLVLEHIQDVGFVFGQAGQALKPGGLFYIGELHPFKQYQGSKARFDDGTGIFELDCFVHHVSDFMAAGEASGFRCVALREWFDEHDRTNGPRILALLFQKNTTGQQKSVRLIVQ